MEGGAADQRALSGVVREVHAQLAADFADVQPSQEMGLWVNNVASMHGALANYAHAMHALGSACWHSGGGCPDSNATQECSEPTTSPNAEDERCRMLRQLLHDFFVGSDSVVCLRGAAALKALRRCYFAEHDGSVMAPELVQHHIRHINATCGVPCGPIRMLDVGSCYNPFERIMPHTVAVTAVDLCPAVPSVLRCDWLQVDFGDSWNVVAPTDAAPSTEVVPCGGTVRTLPQSSFHAVVMCYMLSFLPTAGLRWTACMQALRALAPNGLLVIMEPRRGAQRKQWPQRWAAALRCGGFAPLRVHFMASTAVLAMRKDDECPPPALDNAAAATVAQQLTFD